MPDRFPKSRADKLGAQVPIAQQPPLKKRISIGMIIFLTVLASFGTHCINPIAEWHEHLDLEARCDALSEKPGQNRNSVREVLKSLFYIFLSGTHAPIETRARIIEEQVDSDDQDRQDLGLLLLDAALEARHFSAYHDLGFGARPRDYGFHPQNYEEFAHWFEIVIGICARLAISDRPISQQARKILADNMRGSWTEGGMFETLENAAREIHAQQAWNEGWIAVRGIIRYDSKHFKDDVSERLCPFGESVMRRKKCR